MIDDYEIAEEVVSECESFLRVDPRLPTRRKRVAIARHICCYLMREHTDMSFPEIAEYMDYKDHSSVFHAVAKIKADQILRKRAETLWLRTSNMEHKVIHMGAA